MKAIRVHQFGGPEVLKLESATDPKPQPDEILVAVKAAGINPVDTYIRSGIYGTREFPFTPGMDAAGRVESVGSRTSRFKPDDRVFICGSVTGTYAEKAAAKETRVHSLPESLSFEQGAAIGVVYTTAHYALFGRGNARRGETVLIHGASGGVGTAAIQLAKAAGLTVFGTAGTARGLDLVKAQGADASWDHSQPDDLDQALKATGNKGVDLIIEMLANINLAKDLAILARHGRVIVVGSRGKAEIDPRETMKRLSDIRGLSILMLSEEERAAVEAGVDAAVRDGIVRPVIGARFPLAEAAKAHEAVMAPGACGKIVLIP